MDCFLLILLFTCSFIPSAKLQEFESEESGSGDTSRRKINGPGDNVCSVTTTTIEYVERSVPTRSWSTAVVVGWKNCVCSYSYFCNTMYYKKKIGRKWKCVKDIFRIRNETRWGCETVTKTDYYCCKGYVEKDGECVSEKVCEEDNGGCDQLCSESTTRYPKCDCYAGFKWNKYKNICEDVNECKIYNKNGGCDGECKNTEGSYYCECRDGFELKEDRHTCQDIDECEFDNGGCQQVCTNTKGSWKCDCNAGYKLEERVKCEVISFCDIFFGNCRDMCSDLTLGSSICDCDETKMKVMNTHCKENNPCTENNGGCSHICSYENEKLTCECPEGHTKNSDQTCEDIDECLDLNVGCSHTCVNRIGTYECFCPEDYELDLLDNITCISTSMSEFPGPAPQNSDKSSPLPSIIAGAVIGVLFLCFIIFILLFFLKRMRDKKINAEKDVSITKSKDLENAGFDNHGYGKGFIENTTMTTNTYYSNNAPLPSAPALPKKENIYDNSESSKDKTYSEPPSISYTLPPTNPPPRLIDESDSGSQSPYYSPI